MNCFAIDAGDSLAADDRERVAALAEHLGHDANAARPQCGAGLAAVNQVIDPVVLVIGRLEM